ncbi:MAG TPA: DMT family transporter [Patescibacteria group bacterium]
MKFSKTHLAILLLISANIIWGGGPPIFKWAFENVHTFTLAFLRYFIPVVIMIVLFPNYLYMAKKDLLKVMAASFFGITVNIGLYFIAIHYTASINAAIIASAGPAFLILLSIFFLKEHPTRKMLVGNLIGLTGVLLIVLESTSKMNAGSSLFGNILLVISTIGSVINVIIAKEVIKKYHAITITFWTFLFGTISFYPFLLWESSKYGFLTNLNFQGIFGILYGALLTSFFAWFVFFWALKHMSASSTAVFDYIQPVVSVIVAIPLVHEIPNAFFLIGASLVIGGMYFAENHKSHPHLHHIMMRK